ncbi:MAG: HDOD domain-containing protein [Candidatus Adiutrix sp.]|jgi:HD-like signal output (HDOD) protein|nr:HDOD domain-containing protein [Candidatus Adiutrix sp.]
MTNIEAIIDPHLCSRIKEIGRLSTLPQVTWELMRLLSDETTTSEDLQKVVEQDPALSAKVISLGNSAYYGLRTPATTISRAIVIIGFKELEFLALGLGLADTFDLRKVPYGFDGEALWLHSLSVSWTAREVAAATRLVDSGEAMLAGLLHNLGQIMLVTNFTVQLQKLMNYVNEGHSFAEAEAFLGLWHEAVGYLLARSWGMPQYLQDVILYHHRPEIASGNRNIVSVINLAIELVGLTDFGLEHEKSRSERPGGPEVLPQVSRDEKDKILEKLKNTLPLMAPAWLQMMGPARKKAG